MAKVRVKLQIKNKKTAFGMENIQIVESNSKCNKVILNFRRNKGAAN